MIAIAPQAWFDAFELSKVLSFLPDSWLAGMNAQFDGIPTGKFAFFIGVMCLKGSAIGALSALPYAMAADVIDLDSARTGKRQGGAYFSIWTMTRKLAYALGLVVGTTAATIVGFNSLADPIGDPNTAYSLIWLACLYSIVPRAVQIHRGTHALALPADGRKASGSAARNCCWQTNRMTKSQFIGH